MNKEDKKPFLNIGFKNTVLTNDIVGIFSYKISSYIINSEFLEKKEKKGLIDKISKRDKKSFILIKDGSIIVSPLGVETLVRRSK